MTVERLPVSGRSIITYQLTTDIDLDYQSISDGIAILSFKHRWTGDLVAREHVGLQVFDDGTPKLDTAWLKDGQCVMYQVPDGDGRHRHSVVIQGREVCVLHPVAFVEVSPTPDLTVPFLK